MKTGISTASLYLRKETEDALTVIKSLGADCAELFYQTFYEYRPEFSATLDRGIEVSSVHVNTFHIENALFSRSRRIRGDGFYWLDQAMRSAQLLGCKAYTFHGKPDKGLAPDVDTEAEYIRAASEFCARYGVRLCLENVAWCTYNKAGKFSELKKRIPELYGVLDIKQARRSGYPYKDYIKDMKGSISHVHLSDVDLKGRMCLPGRGTLDFKEILSRLRDADFDGSVIIEVYNENYSDISELKTSLDYLKDIVNGLK